MARNTRSTKLENRSSRLKLPIAKKPYYVKIDRGIALGYRKNAGAGTWVVRVTRAGRDWTAKIGVADDYQEAAAGSALTWWTAQTRARELAVGQYESDTSKPATVASALDAYALDLQTRAASPENAQMVRGHLPSALAAKPITLLTARELRAWRDSLLTHGLAPASVTRICKSFKAAINLAASHDPRITNAAAWKIGLAALPDAQRARNVILPEESVRAIVAAAWNVDSELGLLVECAAVTGARVSQLARLNVEDLKDGPNPRLSMPGAKKGAARKRVTHYPVPIPVSLALKLHSNRSPGEPLLLHHGQRWERGYHGVPFQEAVTRAGFDPAEVTIYALRHSSIVRQLLLGIPIRVVAISHDTSVTMIEHNYSQQLGSHTDELTRAAMLDLGAPRSSPGISLRG